MDIEQLFILNVSGVTEKYLGNSYFCYEGGKNIINNIFSDAIVIHCGIFYILILKKKKTAHLWFSAQNVEEASQN